MRSDKCVMSDLDLIVYFYTLFEDRIFQCASIDSGVGTNFHIIANPHGTQLWNLHPYTVVICEPKAITSNDNTRMNQDAFPNDNIPTKRYVGHKLGVIANGNPRIHSATGTNIYFFTD